RYEELRAAPVDIVAGEGKDQPAAARPEPPPLLAGDERPIIPPLGWPPGVLLVLGLGAPAIAFAARRRALFRWFRGRRPAPPPVTLQSLHQDFRSALERLVPAAGLREGNQLADALRAAGI